MSQAASNLAALRSCTILKTLIDKKEWEQVSKKQIGYGKVTFLSRVLGQKNFSSTFLGSSAGLIITSTTDR